MFIPSLFSRFLSPCVKVPCEGQWHAFHGRFHRTVPSRFRCRCFFMCKEALSSEEDSRKGTLIKLVRRIRLVYVFWEANSFFQKSFKRFSHCPCSARLVTCATSRVPLCACTQQWPWGGRTVDPLPPPESWPHLSQGLAALKWLPPLNYKENYVKHRNWVKRGAACSPSVMWRHCLQGTCKDHLFLGNILGLDHCLLLNKNLIQYVKSESVRRSVVSDSLQPYGLSPVRPLSVHGILWASILQWVAMPSSRGSSQPRDRTQVSWIVGRFFILWATWEA